MDWFILQFVNTIYFKETNYIIFDNVLKENSIEYCEIIDREVYNGVQMQHMGVDFPQFIIDRLIEGCAVFLRLNHKYIPQSQQQYDLNHEGLITEYDGDSDCFTLWDFFNGQKYKSIQISSKILKQATKTFEELNGFDINSVEKTSKIIAFRNKKSSGDLVTRYEPRLLSFLLERWLTGEQVGNHCYGRLCYDFTKIIIKENIDALDTRVFHVFFDHKIALLKSVQYLMMSNKITYDNILLDKLKNLQELALLSRNILLKYRIEHTTPELYSKKLLMYVEQIDKLDQEVFFALYKSIRSTLSHI